jgi:hypothetical protein
MSSKLIVATVIAISCFTGSCQKLSASQGDAYLLTWMTTGFLNQRDFAVGAVIDTSDKIYLAGETGPLLGTGGNGPTSLAAKYNSTGAREWLSPAYSSSANDASSGIAIDSSNNVFIAGRTMRYGGTDAFIVKYDQNGANLWERHIVGPSPSTAFAQAIAVDSLGNAYISGSVLGDLGTGTHGTNYDGFIAKYAPSGDKLWTMQFPDSLGNTANALSTDTTGNIFVAGGISIGIDSYIAKLDGNRTVQWRITPDFSTIAGRHTEVENSTTDSGGNLYVVGETNSMYTNALGFVSTDGFIAKFDPSGQLLWEQRIALSNNDVLSALTLDSLGNVYAAGHTADTQFGVADSIWMKYDSSGNQLWLQEFGTLENDSASGIAVDHAGRVYVTGNIVRDLGDIESADADAYVDRFDPVPEPNSVKLLLLTLLPLLIYRCRRDHCCLAV